MHLVPEWCDDTWKHISPLCETVGKLTNTTLYVFTDSVLCLGGGCQEYPGPMNAWETLIEFSVQSKEYRELHDLTRHPAQFDRRISPERTTTKILQELKTMMAKNTSPSEFRGRIICMSMFNDIEW